MKSRRQRFLMELGLPGLNTQFSQEIVLWAGPGGDESRGHKQDPKKVGTLAIFPVIRVTYD